MTPIPIDSISDPRIADYANIRDAELLQRANPLDPLAHGGLFIAEGDLVVRRLIASRFTTCSILTTRTRFDALGTDLALLPAHTPIYIAAQNTLNQIVGFNMHRGLLAIGQRPPTAHTSTYLTPILALPGPIVILEDLVNHDNIGGVFRNAAALGGPGCAVLLSPRCADPLYRKSLRVSMGHVLSVPFARLNDWPIGLDLIKQSGFRILAMTPAPDSFDIARFEPPSPTQPSRLAILLGTEGVGLSEHALRAADARVRIRMLPSASGESIDSLNVHVAAAIALHRLAITT